MEAGELLKAFMRSVAQPVFLVTARGESGYAAFTASSVTSISLNPPLMMVSVAKGSRSHDPLVTAKYFFITLLSSDDVDKARVLAEKADPLEKLRRVGYRETEKGPLVEGRGYLILERYAVYDGGDHSIVLGRVVGGSVEAPVKCPLVYHNREYKTISGCMLRG